MGKLGETREDLVVKIVSRIGELSTFDYNHEGWWTLSALVDQPIPSLRGFTEEEHDSQITELYDLISDDPEAMELLHGMYSQMRENGGRLA